MAPRCALHEDAVCLLAALKSALDKNGEVTLRQTDLGPGLMGATVFGESLVAIAPDLTPNEWRSTLAHELVHLARGPVSTERAAVEEHQVQKETARMLVPAGPALAQLDRQWTEQEIQDLAARFAVDRDTVETALRAPIFMPLPRPRSN